MTPLHGLNASSTTLPLIGHWMIKKRSSLGSLCFGIDCTWSLFCLWDIISRVTWEVFSLCRRRLWGFGDGWMIRPCCFDFRIHKGNFAKQLVSWTFHLFSASQLNVSIKTPEREAAQIWNKVLGSVLNGCETAAIRQSSCETELKFFMFSQGLAGWKRPLAL